MLQLTQKLKNGEMKILEVPRPMAIPGTVLVRNHFSLISSGTEVSTIKSARRGIIGKAMERPQQARQVLDTILSQGFRQAYRAVMKKLDAFSPLGYSSSGIVAAVGEGISDLQVGDLVACAGLTAAHAEWVCVPRKLCVQLPPEADLRQAAYNTLGAIAMQGVRQADLRLGETCAVIGLGLLGQLTGLILRAAGVRVVGIDVDPAMVGLARGRSTDLALHRGEGGSEQAVLDFTRGLGCDAVIITAGTSSLDPINFAGALARKRGVIVVVGAVPTGFDRDPHYYRKELQVRMSCSYGPGRYDLDYEVKGRDYPAAYVRWTENRNMEAFQQLILDGRLDAGWLTTHTFPLADAPAAYDLLLKRPEPVVGILLDYGVPVGQVAQAAPPVREIGAPGTGALGIGFIGAGSYAQSHLLPNLPLDSNIRLQGVMTTTSTSSKSVADRFGFGYATCDDKRIFMDPSIGVVFIASRHDSHAEYVIRALEAGKHVFVEKPLCLTLHQLDQIGEALARTPKQTQLMVGFNRRFAPLAETLKRALPGKTPLSMLYRINAGHIPADSWIQDPDLGGGRILGEVCHFVDFMGFLCGAKPVSVAAAAMAAPGRIQDTVSLLISYENGSVGTIAYCSNGDKGLPKERIEVYAAGRTAVLDDFKCLHIYSNGKCRSTKSFVQDKGQKAMVAQFLGTLQRESGPLITFTEIRATTLVTLKALESITSGSVLGI